MQIKSVIRMAAPLIPLLIGVLLIAIVFFTDVKGAQLVFRIKLELAILFLCGFLSAALLLMSFVRRRHNKALGSQRSQQQQDSRDEHQRFIRRLDHELKNPLTAIQLGLANMRSLSNDANLQEAIGNIDTQVTRLNTLTTDLRKLAVFDHQEVTFEEVNIADLLNETKEMCEEDGLTNDRNIRLILPAAPWPVPNVSGDSDLLQLALYNVIENAIKYSDSGDHVDIRASDNDAMVTIEIADTGVGIRQSDIDQVWEELFRGENTRNRTGTGIGLSLVKRIIDRHHGELSVVSKEKTGTRIFISLPIRSSH